MAGAGTEQRELTPLRGFELLAGIPLSSELHTLNLHCNQISRIESLGHMLNLQHLDLSSNRIHRIEGLSSLTNLRTLNLACNLITKVEGLEKLFNLTRLNLSYNRIHDLTGLLYLRGANFKISSLELHGNCISNINHLLQCLVGLQYLSNLSLEKSGKSNPVCAKIGYREILLQALPQLTILDGRNIFGEPVNLAEANSTDLKCLEGLLDSSHHLCFVSFKQTCINLPVMTPRIDEVLAQFRQRVCTPTWPATSSSPEGISSSEPERIKLDSDMRIKKLEDQISQLLEKVTVYISPSGLTDVCLLMNIGTYETALYLFLLWNIWDLCLVQALIQELDQEREKRWKAEQAEKKLRENIKELQDQAKEEKGIQSMAVYTTDRLKELVLRERNAKTKLQVDIQHLKDEVERLHRELDQSRHKVEDQQKALQTLEETLSKVETQRAQRQALERKQIQAAELKVSASEREKVEQVHELLMLREQEHRKELETRVTLTGSEFQEALSKEVAREQQRHEHHIKELQGKNALLHQKYKDLEDEFRFALTIEARRFTEVKEGFDNVAAELAEHKHLLAQSLQKEKQSATLIQELTSMVKEQKMKIAELVRSKQETTHNLRSQIRTLENMVEEDKQATIQLELLKQEKSKLISQITAQESVIDGLKAERKIWGQELAQQGASLAQDRGKLEAKIEVLTSENETLRRQNERNNDALKIKSKIVEDQTETIRKLKEASQDRDEQIRKHREESTEMQKRLQVQLEGRETQLDDLMEKLERQNERKEELKQQLQEKETELEDIKKAYSAMNKKWQDKGGLLSKLEAQVKQMKENFDMKEKQLIEERDKSIQAQKAVVEKLHSMDDAFRRQLESTLAAHQAELLQLANEKQQQIAAANEKVYQVEEEMRQLLQETASNKKAMEEKIKRLTVALSDIQQEL
uniref:Leucine rich repeat and coiled-coil centrosomal protein 1 n=1 Tax=Podarcis muralis TaxID=64176 RepID=A0A670IFQ3_PODMU